MKKLSVLFFVISLIVITLGCSQKNEVNEKTYKVFQNGYKLAIAPSDADTSKLVYLYTTVEVLVNSWTGTYRGWREINPDSYFENNTYFKVSIGFDGYGLCKNDKLVIPCTYRDINSENEGTHFWKVKNLNGSLSLLSSNGELVYHPLNDNVQMRYHNDTICYLDVLDSAFVFTGTDLLGPFKWIGRFRSESETYNFITYDGKKSGTVSRYGEKIVEFPYENTYGPMNGGLYYVNKNGAKGIVDVNGKIIVPLKKWDCSLDIESDSTITFIHKNEWGFYDLRGNKHCLSEKFPTLLIQSNFVSGTAIVKDKNTGLYGLLSKTGKMILSCEFEDCYAYNEELCYFEKNNIEALFRRDTGELLKFRSY